MTKCLVIIPAYNEEESVGNVIYKIKQIQMSSALDVVVIDDGSQDRTSEVARAEGAYVIRLPINLGIGGAMQTGYLYALRAGYDVAIQIDADGQHDPGDLPNLISSIEAGQADLVLGSRYVEKTGYQSSLMRRVGMILFSAAIGAIIGYPIKDTTSGYRAVNQGLIRLFSEWYPSDYPEVEVLVAIHRKGFRIKEVPVKMQARQAGRSSITPIKSTYYMSKVFLAVFLNILRPSKAHGSNGGS